MIVGFDHRVVVRNDDLAIAHERDDRRALRQFNVFNLAVDNLGFAFFAMCNCFNRFGGTTAQGMHLDDVATPHVCQQRADGYLLWRYGNVDAARLYEIDVRRAVDQRHDFVRAKPFRQHRAQDIGFFRVRQRAEHIDVVDVFLKQQLLIGSVANKHDCLIKLFGNIAGTLWITLNYFDLVGLFERECQAYADIATAGNDYAPHRVFEAAHFAHKDANVLAVGNEKILRRLPE